MCHVYGEKRKTSVNDTRASMFWKKINRTNKVIDLSLLPCRRSFFETRKRANYVAMIWKEASLAMMNIECPTAHSWLADYQINWVDEAYPDDVEELLLELPVYDSSLSRDVEHDSETVKMTAAHKRTLLICDFIKWTNICIKSRGKNDTYFFLNLLIVYVMSWLQFDVGVKTPIFEHQTAIISL